jgi:glycosyltransferase involved in cell wall biosynthesis
MNSVSRPLVSVVMATYNRSNLLPYVVETVRRQTYANWELLVVGDGCTDDTAGVVSAFDDGRIRFWNLEPPAGEQSGPNNAGCSAARGDYVAFLNHDDFWTPWHLDRAVAALEAESDLDLVYGLNVSVQPDGRSVLWGPTPPGARLPAAGVPASAWVFRRTLIGRVGPWRPARDLYQVPSQDWLGRASRAGRISLLPHLSVLSLPSNTRARSYADRAEDEHAAWFRRMTTDPQWAEDLLSRLLCDRDLSSWKSGNSQAVAPFVGRAIKNAGKRCLSLAGVSPIGAAMWYRYGRRGGFIAHARRVRGI